MDLKQRIANLEISQEEPVPIVNNAFPLEESFREELVLREFEVLKLTEELTNAKNHMGDPNQTI